MTDIADLPAMAAQDVHRPYLHIHPRHGWLNDPNGLVRIDGTYHVFYQHNPVAPVHADICWGHVSSPDLLHWTEEPVALAPRPDGPDRGGCWSGCLVDDTGTPTAVYTGVRSSSRDAGVLLARSDRSLRSWAGESAWAVGTPDDPRISDVRDPFVFTFEGRRYAVQGAGHVAGEPQLLLYGCDDLTAWTELGPLLTTEDPVAAAVAAANIWECPNVVRLGDSWVIILSLWRDHVLSGVRYLVGDLVPHGDGLRFAARSGGVLDAGPTFYAPQALVEHDRVLIWGWAWEGAERTAEEVERAGWSGTLTSPRELRLVDDVVTSHPARELVGLRRERIETPERPFELAAFELTASAAFELALVGVDGQRRVVVDNPGAGQLLVDGSLVEVFSGEQSSTTRAYRRAEERWQVSVAGPSELWRLGLDAGRVHRPR